MNCQKFFLAVFLLLIGISSTGFRRGNGLSQDTLFHRNQRHEPGFSTVVFTSGAQHDVHRSGNGYESRYEHGAPSVVVQDWDCWIFGQVVSDGRPVPGVRVILEGPVQAAATTDSDGQYSFHKLQPGTYQLTFHAGDRFQQQTTSITLKGTRTLLGWQGEKKQLNISLAGLGTTPTPQPSTIPTPRPTPSGTPSPQPTPSPRATPEPKASPRVVTNVNGQANVNTNTSTNANTSTNENANTRTPSLEEQINTMIGGKIVYEIPSIMRVGNNSVIKVGIAKEITEDINARIAKDRNTTVQNLKVKDVMDVDLISEEAGAFDVQRQQPRPGLPGWQVIGGDTASEWIFDVTPRQAGTHKLKLIATVLLNDPKNQSQPKSFNVYDRDITVSTDYLYYAREFLRSYWQFLLTTLLLPAGAVAWRLLKKRKGPPAPPDWQNAG